jgi:transposase
LEQWVTTRIGGYVRLSVEERREAVKELTGEGMSQREVAEVLGVHQTTVHEDLKSDGNSSQKANSPGKSDGNSSLVSDAPKPEHNVAKELEQAERKAGADRLTRTRVASVWTTL